MTSSNIANMLVQTVSNANSVMNDMKMESESKFNISFDKTLQVATNSGRNDNTSTFEREVKASNDINVDNSKRIKVKSETKAEKTEGTDDSISGEIPKDFEEKVDAFDSKVKELVQETLDVSEEDLEEALLNLGLVPIDLLNPQNLTNLMIELDENIDPVSLLMDGGFKDLLDGIEDLTNQLLEDVNLSSIEIKDFMIPVEDKDFDKILIEEGFEELKPDKTVEIVEEIGFNTTEMVEEIPGEKSIQSTDKASEDFTGEKVENEAGFLEKQIHTESESKDSEDSKQFLSKDSSDNKLNFKINDNDGPSAIINPEKTFDFVYSVKEESIYLPNGESISTQEVIDQIVEQAKVFTDSDTTTMEMILKPEGLGKIIMEVSQKGEEITAKIFTENETVKEALENQMASLRTQINDSSTKITSIEVSVGAHEFERNLEEDARNQQNAEHNQGKKQHGRRIDLNSLDELSGLMTDEEQLVYQIMRENGNTLDYQV